MNDQRKVEVAHRYLVNKINIQDVAVYIAPYSLTYRVWRHPIVLTLPSRRIYTTA